MLLRELVQSWLGTNSKHFGQQPGVDLGRALKLVGCVTGIYVCFLTWGVLQERISTLSYTALLNDGSVVTDRFRYFVVLNTLQAMVAALLAYASLKLQRQRSLSLLIQAAINNRTLAFHLARLAFSICIASPFGYAALQHITYPTMILGKSCKLIPVMMVSVGIYGKRYPMNKYLTVVLITFGVTVFMLFDGSHGSGKGSKNNSLWGITLLLINLFIDGLTNAWQDELFHRYRLKSHQVMLCVNAISSLLMSTYLLASFRELSRFLSFIHMYPSALIDMLAFSVCGAAGQLFIFYTIEQFGSVMLVTVTVTRKLATMLVSLTWFGHSVRWQQGIGMLVVFVALCSETFSHKSK